MAGKSVQWVLAAGFIFAGFGIPSCGNADPVTLYKARNIAIARENVQRYPWARKIVEDWKANAEANVLSRDPGFFERMLSETTPWPEYGQTCPACVGRLSSMGETGLYRWSVTDPDHLTCKYCGTVYPNQKYPELGSMTAKRMGQTFTFYLTDEERAHPEDRTGQYAFHWAQWPVHTSWSGIIRYRKAVWCQEQVLFLAKLYAITGNVRYAQGAALIMDALAKVYPHWLYHSYNGTYADCPGNEAAAEMGKNLPAGKFPVETIITAIPGYHVKDGYAVLNNGFWGGGRFGCSGTDAGMILNMTVAYDLIHEAKKADGSPVLTPSMDHRIVNDLILSGVTDCEYYNEINNKCGPTRALSAAAGILFERPESVRRALDGFDALMNMCFHSDGFCAESPSYSEMHLYLMRNIPEILLGYSDPAGYRSPDGRTFVGFNPFESVGRYRLALESMVRMLDVTGKYPLIGDTHFGTGISPEYLEILASHYDSKYAGLLVKAQGAPLAEKGSEYALWRRDPYLLADPAATLPLRTEWFPGWHVGVLRAGGPASGSNLYFNGYADHGHRHFDTLGIIYYAFGKELLSDRGYIWDDPRKEWTQSTLAHNVVVVDGEGQNTGSDRASTLELFAASPGVEVVQASASAYRQCDVYRRTSALVRMPEGGTYLVDFFRVKGGKKHQYAFNCNGVLQGIQGADLRSAPDSIPWLSNIRESFPRNPVTATWRYEDVNVGVTVLSPMTRFLVTDAPGWRTNKGLDMNAPPVAECIAEHTDPERAVSRFATVTMPYAGESSPIASMRLLHPDGADGDAMAVEVTFTDGRKDYILSAPDGSAKNYGPLSMTGAFGYVSLDARGHIQRSFLADGVSLRAGGETVALPEAGKTYAVTSVEGRTYRLATPISGGAANVGKFLLAHDTGYEIETVNGDTVVLRDYPAVKASTVRIVNTVWKDRGNAR